MRASEILQKLVNVIDAAETQSAAEPAAEPGKLKRVPVSLKAEPHDEPELDIMVPPLQQKIELLKKATGVPSAYDHFTDAESDDLGCEQADELADIRKMAGMPVIAVQTAAEDNDVFD
jgi:uncharacterized protein YeaO (DUF488 family)